MKKLFVVVCAALVALCGCQTVGGIAQNVGGKLTDYSNKQESGILKTATGVAGSTYTAAGNAVAPKKVEAAKTPAADKKEPAPVTPTAKAPTAVKKVKAAAPKDVPTATKKDM